MKISKAANSFDVMMLQRYEVKLACQLARPLPVCPEVPVILPWSQSSQCELLAAWLMS